MSSLPGMSLKSRENNVVTFADSSAQTGAAKLRRSALANKTRCMVILIPTATDVSIRGEPGSLAVFSECGRRTGQNSRRGSDYLIGFHGLGTLDPAREGFSLAWDLPC